MFTTILDRLLKEKGIPVAKMLEDCKIGKNQYTYWKKNNNIPNGTTLQKLADYFNVSVDYLLGNEKQNKLPDNADAIIEEFLNTKSNMAIVMGKGGDRRVIEVPEDAEAYIQSFIDAINKKKDK